jgi:hypothetical protein
MAVFWVVAPCSLVEVYRRFRGICCLHHQDYNNGGTSETSVKFCHTARRNNPEDSHLLPCRRDNLKSHLIKTRYIIQTEDINFADLQSVSEPTVYGGATFSFYNKIKVRSYDTSNLVLILEHFSMAQFLIRSFLAMSHLTSPHPTLNLATRQAVVRAGSTRISITATIDSTVINGDSGNATGSVGPSVHLTQGWSESAPSARLFASVPHRDGLLQGNVVRQSVKHLAK